MQLALILLEQYICSLSVRSKRNNYRDRESKRIMMVMVRMQHATGSEGGREGKIRLSTRRITDYQLYQCPTSVGNVTGRVLLPVGTHLTGSISGNISSR